MLIDFSDVLGINLYELGRCYLKLMNDLSLAKEKIPLIDPSLFMRRFCDKLEFEGEEAKIERTALKLLQSMRREWAGTGRRPNGLCGAAILIAARLHGFKRSTA